MSLINDALKRAQEAQQKNPATPPPGPPLRPAEPRHGRATGPMALLVAVLLLVLAGTGLMLWQWTRMNAKSPPEGKVVAQPTPAPIADEPPAGVIQPAGQAAAVAQKPEAATPPARLPQPNEPTAPVDSPPPAQAQAGAATTAGTSATPQPAQLRLQGIFYSARGSTAIINGKSVGVGERIGEARVLAITQESVTLLIAGQTNVLML